MDGSISQMRRPKAPAEPSKISQERRVDEDNAVVMAK
jgi:hypothetical protein